MRDCVSQTFKRIAGRRCVKGNLTHAMPWIWKHVRNGEKERVGAYAVRPYTSSYDESFRTDLAVSVPVAIAVLAAVVVWVAAGDLAPAGAAPVALGVVPALVAV